MVQTSIIAFFLPKGQDFFFVRNVIRRGENLTWHNLSYQHHVRLFWKTFLAKGIEDSSSRTPLYGVFLLNIEEIKLNKG